MKRIVFIFCLISAKYSTCQLINEKFGAGIPAGWTQSPAASWTLHSTFGFSNTACIISQEIGSTSSTANVQTSTFNLTGIVNPTVNFKAAITKNNFLPGNLVLYYDQGGGPQFVARWGSGISPNTTYTISEDGFDPVHPLDPENIFWHSYTHTMSSTGNTVSIILAAEFINGGYILFDDIQVLGTAVNTTALEKEEDPENIQLFPNPVKGTSVHIVSPHTLTVEVYNQLGQISPAVIERKNEDTFELDVTHLSSGVYYVLLQAMDKRVFHKKLVVN
jgi:hypothetical protein